MTIVAASFIYLYNTTISCETVKAEMSANSKKVAELKVTSCQCENLQQTAVIIANAADLGHSWQH